MSVFGYRVAHTLGFRPWEAAARHGDAPRILATEFNREQARAQAPWGAALDLGCGTGVHAVELARRGWQVTGVDIVRKAIRRATKRARAAGVDVRFLEGDITALPAQVGTGYRLILDFGAFHGLTDPERHALGRQVDTAAAADATLLMIAVEPGRRGPLPRGAAPTDITTAFPGWTIVDDVLLPKHPIGTLHLYRLRRADNRR
ncbi:class I SAM-dependent methyltransferase [Nocardia sp. CA2R105]|uniref:class I SAM-dependent methyltransferase n=1 Tax=Nocardia coffeae TaxID=2873381 RepID=UPI001CA701AD|nr:class I SAM-dependent methyltransferase [Nocardia coffeae]MBY8857138.1 class I SAM-dependent methyltransferase [Nocardia coffeae]